MSRCHDIICGGCDKKLRRFHASLSCTMLTTLSVSSWNHETSSEILRFVSIVRDNLRETFSNFYHNLHIWYHDISTSFKIFGLRLLFIEFKDNSTASSWSCFVNKMFKIGGLVLDTASHYTKKYEYHFFIHFFIIRMTSSYNLNYPRKFN